MGTGPEMDPALLKVNLSNVTETKISDSDVLRVGDFVLAIGNNYGLAATVTSGIGCDVFEQCVLRNHFLMWDLKNFGMKSL